MIGDDAVERGDDVGKAKIYGRSFEIGLVNSNGSLVLLDDESLVLRLLCRN